MEVADQSEGGKRQALATKLPTRRTASQAVRAADSFGLVLLLVVLDYVAVSTVSGSGWGTVAIVILEGLTLLFALRTSRAGRVWVLLAGAYLLVGTIFTLVGALLPGTRIENPATIIQIVGGVLLAVTPLAIARRIATHPVVTAETLLGAVCVYVLIGYAFASAYAAVAVFSGAPFFTGVQHATENEYLFFSYTPLTTVGYGNLVPESNIGQTLAMLEAMLGQVYLVIVVSRLVSMWGRALPRNLPPRDTTTGDA